MGLLDASGIPLAMTISYQRTKITNQKKLRAALDSRVPAANFQLVVPWWANPLWALTLLTGVMMLLSIVASQRIYDNWLVAKFISDEHATVLVILFLSLFTGILFTSGISPRARVIDIEFTQRQINIARRAYFVFLWLAIVGYIIWVTSAFVQGVRFTDLAAVLTREPGAISGLKESARPIGGVTTLTQFGPVVVALNLLLWRAGYRHLLGLVVLFLASLIRFFFYAERLAVLELVVAGCLTGAMILSADPRWRTRIAVFPVVAVPAVWGMFAASEYFRSWIYYRQFTDSSFAEWVSARMFGYYVTSFNNSALIVDNYNSYSSIPWFSAQWFWSFPVIESKVEHPGISGLQADQWLTRTLESSANINFTNPGSFLTTYAELGLLASMLLWLGTGLVIGAVFRSMNNGNVPALILYATMYIGILELSRIVYWGLGRSTPIIIAFIVLAFLWHRRKPDLDQRPGSVLRSRR